MARKSKSPHSLQAVLVGDPVDGVILYGPFETDDDAVEWAEREVPGTQNWWVTEMRDPDGEV